MATLIGYLCLIAVCLLADVLIGGQKRDKFPCTAAHTTFGWGGCTTVYITLCVSMLFAYHCSKAGPRVGQTG